ncbi:L,D-transpeptidase [Aneurinibacillus tyrosinisolvens]|jgi:lipoprotein-anchoring transpeptidase ErfK/SrfK|uniref:L,D-transpeptidase n=1 Tax=Aneurinibacillus tyrosinisolvens TaxID=1443435 RepID=UPI00063FB174|nr:L,D-transpeptidase [Aneurinibacillus tyrosinisolvens]
MRKILLLSFLIGLFILHYPCEALALEDEVHIEINKTSNQLTVFLNDAPVYTFPVATGKTPELTPEGEFTVITRVKNPWYLPKNIAGGSPDNPLGNRWIGLDVPETRGYKYGIHGTNNPHSIGYRVSQGCIRMRNRDVEWLYRHIPLGTKVIIRHDNSAAEENPSP